MFILFRREDVLDLLQKNGFLIVLLTLVPLLLAAITSSAGKSIGNMTPWEPSKIPFLIGFAAILSVLYKNLARTYWGVAACKRCYSACFYGDFAVCSVFRFEGFRANDGFQFGLCDALSDRRPPFAAKICAGRKRCFARQHFGRRRVAGKNAGKNSASADACRAGQKSFARPNSAAISSLARRI